jgi:hypothetical protein
MKPNEPAKIGDEVKNSTTSGSLRSFLQKSEVAAMLGMSNIFAGASILPASFPEPGNDLIGPDPIYEKPAPQTVEQLAGARVAGVAALEVNDYFVAGRRVGFLNAQIHNYKPGSPYPYSFGPFSHWIIDKPLKNWKVDYFVETRNMELNRWSEKHVYYTLTGTGSDLESIRRLGRQWLDKGAACAGAESIASLPSLRIQPA